MSKLADLKLAYEEAYEERDKAEEERDKAEAVWDKADDECFKAYNAYRDEQYELKRLNKED